MKKFLTFLIAVVIALPTLLLIGCSGDHTHTFATEYSSDATHHWYACTVEDCTETKDKAEHTFDGDTCTVCGYVNTDAIVKTAYTYKPVSTKEIDNSIGLADVYEGVGTMFETILAEDMSIGLSSDNTFVLTLNNVSDFSRWTTEIYGTYTDDGKFTITSTNERKTSFGKTVYEKEVDSTTIKQMTADSTFAIVNDNYFVLQILDFNLVFVKDGYTPVEGEVVVANLPFRTIISMSSPVGCDPMGLPYTLKQSELPLTLSTYGCITEVDENGDLFYRQIEVDRISSINNIDTTPNATVETSDDTLVVGEYRDSTVSLDLNETPTSATTDDTNVPFVRTCVSGISATNSLYINYPSVGRFVYFINSIPENIETKEDLVTMLENMDIHYYVDSSTPAYVTVDMIKEFDLSLDNGKTAKIAIEIPNMDDPTDKQISTFIVPILEETTAVELVDMYIYSMGEVLTVELNGDMDEVVAGCYVDLVFSDDSFEYGPIFDKIDSEKLTYTTVDTSTVGYKTITFTYEYEEGKTISETLLVVVFNPEADSILYMYNPYETIYIDGTATPEEICEYLNSYKISLAGITFDGEYVFDALELDLNDVLGKAEITVADNLWLADIAENGFEFEVNVTVAGEGFGTYTYTQTITIEFELEEGI